jgi:outer membrane protein assembly factor BamB
MKTIRRGADNRSVEKCRLVFGMMVGMVVASALIVITLPAFLDYRCTVMVGIGWIAAISIAATLFVGHPKRPPFWARFAIVICLLAAIGIGSLKYDKRSRWLFKEYGPFTFTYSGDGTRSWHWRWRWTTEEKEAFYDRRELADAPSNSWAEYSYPQYLGHDRNAVVNGLLLATDWRTNPPELLWRRSIGAGWSAFSVDKEIAVTQEQQSEDEVVTAYALLTGEELWAHHRPNTRFDEASGAGPRSTPTIRSGYVYALGATGVLDCLSLTDGKSVWTRNILNDAGADNLQWGVSGSPLVIDGSVIVNPGGQETASSVIAYDATSGERIWNQGESEASYSSPMVAEIDGVRQIVVLNGPSLEGFSLDGNGRLWHYPWQVHGDAMINASQPVLVPNESNTSEQRIFISSGYGKGCALLSVSRDDGDFRVQEVWAPNTTMKAKFTTPVYHQGYVFGLDEGILVCVDLSDGQRLWKKGRYGHGQIMLVGSIILVLAETGEVCLVAADPTEHRELARFSAISGKTWNHAALAGPLLVVRNSNEAACYRLPLAHTNSSLADDSTGQ